MPKVLYPDGVINISANYFPHPSTWCCGDSFPGRGKVLLAGGLHSMNYAFRYQHACVRPVALRLLYVCAALCAGRSRRIRWRDFFSIWKMSTSVGGCSASRGCCIGPALPSSTSIRWAHIGAAASALYICAPQSSISTNGVVFETTHASKSIEKLLPLAGRFLTVNSIVVESETSIGKLRLLVNIDCFSVIDLISLLESRF